MKKLNLPKLASLMPQPKPRKAKTSLRVTASRLVPTAFEDEEEPTTKLSTAFVVVLVLHLVAVGGIYAFHSIKSHRREADGTAVTAGGVKKASGAAATGELAAAKNQGAEKSGPAAVVSQPNLKAQSSSASNFAPTPAPALAKAPAGVPAGGVMEKSPGSSAVLAPQKPASLGTASTAAGANSGVAKIGSSPGSNEAAARTYTVKKGDNPWSIAKTQGVSYDELMKLNGLEDPKKLQFNQVLKLPPKKAGN